MRLNPYRRLAWVAVGLAVLAFLLLVTPLFGTAVSPPVRSNSNGPTGALGSPGLSPASSLSTVVTFQGIPTSGHTDSGSAIVTSFADAFITVFTWQSPGQATLVSRGTVTVLFLGATVGTSSQSLNGAVPALSGTVTLNQTDFSQDKYLFEGIYQLQATLFDQGTPIWNTTFYVWIQAANHLTVINIALILIGAFEIYQIAALGSARVARKQLGLDRPPKTRGP